MLDTQVTVNAASTRLDTLTKWLCRSNNSQARYFDYSRVDPITARLGTLATADAGPITARLDTLTTVGQIQLQLCQIF